MGLLSLSSADHTEIGEIAKGLADRYEGTNTGLSLPSTRVDAFNIDLANELTRMVAGYMATPPDHQGTR